MDEYDDLLARVRSGSTVPAAPALPAAPKMDEYDSLLKQVRTPDLVPAQTANYNGSFSNPAQAAERLNLARDIKKMFGEDIAPSIIDPVEDKRRVRQAEMDHGIQQSATLRKWIEDDPGNAGLVGQKDISSLLSIDGALHAGRRVFGNVVAGLTADPAAAFYTTLAMPFKLGEQALTAAGMPDWLAQSEMGKALLWAARESKKTGDVAAGARGDEGNVEAGVYSGFRSLGGNLGTMLTGGALGLGAKGTTAMMSAIAGGGAALKAFDKDKPATTALTLGLADTAAEYATELPGMKALLATPGLKQGIASFARGVANFGAKEMFGEQVATVWQDFNEWALLNPEKTLDDFIAARPDAAIQTAVATLVGGGGQIAIQQAMVRGRQAETRALFDALHAGAENSELLKAVPEKYREFVKKATVEGGVDTVFIPAEQFTTYFQGRDMDPALIATELGATNYTEAMAVGSDVMIPMDAFATLIAGTEHYTGLADDLRLSQGDMTARELALAEANKGESEKQLEAELQRMAAKTDTTLAAQIKQITDDVALQLGSRYDQKTSETMSQVMRGIAVATARDVQGRAQEQGKTASEAEIQQAISAQLAKYDIRINANPPLPEILTKNPNFRADIDPMLDMIRAGKGPDEADIFGASLVEFIRSRGGLAPVGELADAEKVKTPAFQRKLISELGDSLDGMAMAAVEAGYFPGTEMGQLTESQLVEAILNEISGYRKTFAGFDEAKLNMRETLEGLSKALDQYGLDPKTMDNEAIKAALFAEPTYEQAAEKMLTSDNLKRIQELTAEARSWRETRIKAGDDRVAWDRANQRLLPIAEELGRLTGHPLGLDDAETAARFAGSDQEFKPDQALIDSAVKEFGYTQNPGEAGYILPNGKMLKFGEDGVRGEDHRAISIAFPADEKPSGYSDAMIEFMNRTGAARVDFNSGLFEMQRIPTEAQMRTAIRAAKESGVGILAQASRPDGSQRADLDMDRPSVARLAAFFQETAEGRTFFQKVGAGGTAFKAVDTESAEFKAWFGDSKVVDADGKPLVVGGFYINHNEPLLPKGALEKILKAYAQGVADKKSGNETPEWVFGETDWALTKEQYEIRGIEPWAQKYGDPTVNATISHAVGVAYGAGFNGKRRPEFVVAKRLGSVPASGFSFNRRDNEAEQGVSVMGLVDPTGSEYSESTDQVSAMFMRDRNEHYVVGLEHTFRVGADGENLLMVVTDLGPVGAQIKSATSNTGAFSRENPSILYQPENRAQIRIGPDRKINIDLLKDANFSSFIHETGHFYLEFLGDLAENGSQQTKDDYAAILKWFGIASRDQITVEHHEMFARANERYLMEGKAPSKELRAAFARFKAWLTSIYRNLTALNVPLTDEVREVFDRIYATDAEIAAARAENDFIDTFVTAEQMGVSQGEFEVYKKQAAGEIQEGTDKLRDKIMRVQRLKREQWWRDELAKTKAEVSAELDAMQSYQTFDSLSAKDSELKIDRAELVERFGAPILKRLPRGYGEGRGAIYTAEGERGSNVETVAQLMGYETGDAFIEDMANLKPRRKLIAAEADARMNERYGDILNSIEVADEAQNALHNSERGKKLAMELRALRSLQRQVDPVLKARAKDQAADEKIGRQHSMDQAPLSVFTEAARRVMTTKLIRDIRPNDYLIAERKANQKAFEALGKKNYGEARDFKQQELLNFAMYQEAMRVKEEMKKLHDFVARFEKGPMKEKLSKAGDQYAESAQAILEDVELTNKSLKAIDRTKLRQWLQMQENQDLYVTEDMVSGTFAKNWKDLTVEEMRAIGDALKNIEHVAGRQLKIMVGQKAIDLAEWAKRASESIRANGGKPKDLTMEDGGRFAKFFASFNAQNRKLSSLARQMDGDVEAGPMFEGLIRGMNERGAWEADENAKATKALIELYRPVLAMKGGMKDVRYIPELKTSLSRGARLSMLLNWGNEGNRQRLQASDYGNGILTQDQINAVLKTITRQEAEFVNATWKFIDSYWPQIAAKEKRVYGVAPEKVDALPFQMTLADGTNIQMTGGYYPIKYDATKDDKAAAHDQSQLAEEVMRGAFTAQTTRKGHTEARAETVKRPVRLSLDVITEHVAQVTHDLAWHEWLIDATKILRNKAVSSAIRDHFGDPVLKTMRDDLTGIAVGDLANQTATDTALLHLRANVQRSTMGLSLTTAFMQPFGLTQSMHRIGIKHVLGGIAHWAGDVARFENTLTKIREKSVFMQGRGETFNRELHEIRGRVTGNQSKARQIYDASLFMMMQKMQMIADVPTWLGAYNKALAENPDETLAVALADRAVIESQGGGQTKDLTEFQRKHPMLNVFFSYFSVTYNLMAESTAKTQFTKPAAVASWLADMMLLAVIPALGPAALLALLRGEGDDDEEEWMAKLVKWQVAYLAGTVPLLREGGGTVEGYSYAGPPAARIVTDLQKFGAQVKRAWQNEGDIDEAGILSAVRLMGTALGVPTTQAVRSYKGWKAWEEGNAPATSILVGPPRND